MAAFHTAAASKFIQAVTGVSDRLRFTQTLTQTGGALIYS